MTSLGVLFVMGWLTGILVTAAGLRAERRAVTVLGAAVFVSTVIAWLVVVQNQ